MNFQPVIKWSGSKRSQSEEIIKYFPKEIDTYYEPFVGGASVLRQLLESDIKVNEYHCSDINQDLINLWNEIKDCPEQLVANYKRMWQELNADNDLERKKQYFYTVRANFNKNHIPSDFLFISRTTTNGLIRYNSKGEFNNSFHVTRNGIFPETLREILFDWSEKLNSKNIKFISHSYAEVKTDQNDYLYLDPPYAGTKGMYYGTIDYGQFWNWLKEQKSGFSLSFDGICGYENRTYDVPKSVYDEHVYLYSGCSSFKRLKEQTTEYVKESLYIKKIGKDCREENLIIDQKEETAKI